MKKAALYLSLGCFILAGVFSSCTSDQAVKDPPAPKENHSEGPPTEDSEIVSMDPGETLPDLLLHHLDNLLTAAVTYTVIMLQRNGSRKRAIKNGG